MPANSSTPMTLIARLSALDCTNMLITIATRMPTTPMIRKVPKPDRSYLVVRSEEHTSELQSLMRISYDVFCLKINTSTQKHTTQHTAQLTDTTHTRQLY